MILCLLHQSALRRRLDEGTALPARARLHVAQCARCAAALAAQSAVIRELNATRDRAVTQPPFLHARVMNAVRETRPDSKSILARFAWAVPALAVAMVAALLVVNHGPSKIVAPTNGNVSVELWSRDILDKRLALETADIEKPLQTEIKNLQADTLNAARGLASSFLPTER